MRVLYFAWLRQKIGLSEEEIAPPPTVRDVASLIDFLAARSPGHAEAFANRAVVRCAVNQDFAGPEAPVRAGDEVAFFPPVTGG